MPVALRISAAELNDCRTVANAGPARPSRCTSVDTIDFRNRSGTNAATTMTSGKNETKAFPASATLRSIKVVSSSRSQIFQATVRSTMRCSASIRSSNGLMRL